MLLTHGSLAAPEYIFQEIHKHKRIIKRKAGITEADFSTLQDAILEAVKLYPKQAYQHKLKRAKDISPDPLDASYFALALHLDTAIWTNDKQLQNQSQIQILTTKDLLEPKNKDRT